MRKMKRLLALGLAGMMVLSATGCKSTDKTKDSVAGTTQPQEAHLQEARPQPLPPMVKM